MKYLDYLLHTQELSIQPCLHLCNITYYLYFVEKIVGPVKVQKLLNVYVHLLHWEVYNCRIFLNKKYVFGKSLQKNVMHTEYSICKLYVPNPAVIYYQLQFYYLNHNDQIWW